MNVKEDPCNYHDDIRKDLLSKCKHLASLSNDNMPQIIDGLWMSDEKRFPYGQNSHHSILCCQSQIIPERQ